MSNNSITYQVNLKVVGEDVIGTVTASIKKMTEKTQKATKTFGDCFNCGHSVWLLTATCHKTTNFLKDCHNKPREE